MRILVADQNTLLLAAITATFGPHCDLVTATRRDVCLAQLEQHKFDVVIAADKLSDYTGLELLSEVPVISPDTLLIFAADPKRLQQLGKRLALFGLFEAISYPLTPQKLVDVLRRAREKLQASRQPKVRHVVIESEWDTGERLGLIERELQDGGGSDDFVFAGPPTIPPAPSICAERLVEGTRVVAAAGVPDSVTASNRAAGGRTFEATPVTVTPATGNASDRGGGAESSCEAVVTEYEVEPNLPAPQPTRAKRAPEGDEFVFAAAEVEPGKPMPPAAARTAIEVAPTNVPVAQAVAPVLEPVEAVADEAAPEAEGEFDFHCSNDAVFDVPEPPKWAQDGAANDTAYESKGPLVDRQRVSASESGAGHGRAAAQLPPPPPPAPARPESTSRAHKNSSDAEAPKAASSSSKSAQERKAASPAATPTPKGAPQPRVRAQAVTTEAQRAAFERAVARRKANGGADSAPKEGAQKSGRARPTIKLGSTAGVFTGLPMSGQASRSLSDLAKMATSKRPLAHPKVGGGKAAPNRAVFVVGSGLAAVLVLGVLSFELLRHSGEAERHMPHAQAQSTQLFSSSTTLVASSNGGPAQLVAPAQPSEGAPPQDMPPNQPEPQTFDADSAPEDPPPPPILEHPGPSEPPSAPTMGNTDLPPWALSQQQAWGTTSSDTPNE